MTEFTFKNNRQLEYLKPVHHMGPVNVEQDMEYYLFSTKNKAYNFNVDNVEQTLNIEEFGHPSKIRDMEKFYLWEESYSDLILPGKIERIHKNTLMRCVSYPNKFNESFIIRDEHTIIKLMDLIKNHNKLHELEFDIFYAPTPIVMFMLPYIYNTYELLDLNMPHFRPIWLSEESYTVEEELNNFMSIKTKSLDWMVFSKSHMSKIFFTGSYSEACRIVAKLKFDDTIPFIQCGLNLFEDYYFMPLFYKKMIIDNNNVTVYDPKDELVNIYEIWEETFKNKGE